MTTTLLVANDGGHITQLWNLAPRITAIQDRVWVTPSTFQTRSLLKGERVYWAGSAPTRDWKAVIRNARIIRRILLAEKVDRVISTGSSLALSALPQAAARGIDAHYIESVTRTDGFSVSGRVLRRIPRISMYAQWPHLATGGWVYAGSVLDGFIPSVGVVSSARQVVVSLGTSGSYGFRRLVERLALVIPDGVEVLWQTGSTDTSGLEIDAKATVPAEELAAAIKTADVIIAHAGAGICLTALEAGKIPLLSPRVAAKGEHVDDHQTEIASRLRDAGLAVVADADSITWPQVEAMTALRASTASTLPPFHLRLRHPGVGGDHGVLVDHS